MRIGKIKISAQLIRDMDITEMLKITSRFVVVCCEHTFFEDRFEYVAICPEFDEIADGSVLPEYIAVCHTEVVEDGKSAVITGVEFKRLYDWV